MSRTAVPGVLTSAALFLLAISLPRAAAAGVTPAAVQKLGAQLYDNWPKLKGRTFDDPHPLYPKSGKKGGTSTWRCKECHGWDYLGAEGRYASGSHRTGIAGVLDASSRGAPVLRRILTGGKAGHDFSRYLSPRELDALAEFVNSGTADGRRWTGATGDPGPGEPLYGAHCADCHGDDGLDLDFKPGQEGVQGVGWLARKNPEETLHKILWGHPGSDMPSLVADAGLDRADAARILWYAVGLP